MTKKIKYFSIFILLLVFIGDALDVDAQRRRRARVTRSTEDDQSLKDKIYYGINLGNLDFFSGNFSMSGKFLSGYKFSKRLSAGVGLKSFYDVLEVFGGPDLNLFSFGGGPFGRFKISEEIYFHAEYDFSSYESYDYNTLATFTEKHNYPLVGGGYESGAGDWKYGLQVLFIMDEQVRELPLKSVVEWWLSFSYKF